MNHPPLPPHSILLGWGKSFETNGQEFEGWIWTPQVEEWQYAEATQGKNRNMLYAATIHSEVANLNCKDLSLEMVKEPEKEAPEAKEEPLRRKLPSTWTGPMPVPVFSKPKHQYER